MYLLQSPWLWLRPGFLSLNPIDIWGQIILLWGGTVLCPGGCQAVSLASDYQIQGTLPQSWQSVMSPGNTKGEIMPSGESRMHWLWNTRFQKQNKTKQKYWFSNLTVQGNFWGHCEKCQSLGLWVQGNLINRFEEEPGNLHFIPVQRTLIHFKKLLYLFLP